jgi:hypothetical protein
VFHTAEAGLSKINNIKIEVSTDVKDADKVKSITKRELSDEMYLSIKSRLPQISINESSDYILSLEHYSGRYVLAIGDKNYGAYCITLTLRSAKYFDNDISTYWKVYWQQSVQFTPLNVTEAKSTIKEQIKSLIDNFAKDWYEDQDRDK